MGGNKWGRASWANAWCAADYSSGKGGWGGKAWGGAARAHPYGGKASGGKTSEWQDWSSGSWDASEDTSVRRNRVLVKELFCKAAVRGYPNESGLCLCTTAGQTDLDFLGRRHLQGYLTKENSAMVNNPAVRQVFVTTSSTYNGKSSDWVSFERPTLFWQVYLAPWYQVPYRG